MVTIVTFLGFRQKEKENELIPYLTFCGNSLQAISPFRRAACGLQTMIDNYSPKVCVGLVDLVAFLVLIQQGVFLPSQSRFISDRNPIWRSPPLIVIIQQYGYHPWQIVLLTSFTFPVFLLDCYFILFYTFSIQKQSLINEQRSCLNSSKRGLKQNYV